jgi:hypothetical protein
MCRVDVLRGIATDGSGDMLGVADSFLGVEGFLVDVACLQDIHHIAEVSAEALPGALGVVDGAGNGEDVTGFVDMSFCCGAEVYEWDGERAVAVFGTGMSQSYIGIVGAGIIGIPPRDDADRLGSVAGALDGAECAEAPCSDDAAATLDGEEDFLVPWGESLVEESINQYERVGTFQCGGSDVALLRWRAYVGIGRDIAGASGADKDFHPFLLARDPRAMCRL